MRVERLPQTVQADAFHLFSIGEGIAYGSSLLNYVVSGAPVPAFKVELSDEFFNVEFTGKDIRNWRKVEGGYVVQLQTPVAGAYALLATYERPFKPQGETLTFTGARPLDAQSEQGYTLVISDHQFQVKTETVSRGLLRAGDRRGARPNTASSSTRRSWLLTAMRRARSISSSRSVHWPRAIRSTRSWTAPRLPTHISKEGQVADRRALFRQEPRQPQFPPDAPARRRVLVGSPSTAPAVVPVLDGQANLIPLPTARGSQRRADH